MKKKNKIFNRVVAGTLIVGLLTAIGIGAYLTDTDVKQDVYTVGNVQAEIVSNGDMEVGNVGALLPGTVHRYERAAMNTGINDAYVFMSITIPYEMIGVADSDGTQLGEKTMQIFIPGSADGYVSSEWKLVDSGFIGEYEIEENEQLNGEHEQYSTVVGNTITYVYGYIGDNADGSLKALASGETTANLVETMELTNLYRADNINGEVSTKLYAIQSANVNGGLTDVNGVWAVINHALVGTENEVQTANALMVGELFNAYIPDDVSSVEFVAMPQTYGLRNATAPEGAFDVSAAQDGSVMAWSEDGVFYVAAMNGEKIIANKNSDKMFYEKTNLTYINTENLDMSQVESAAYMFKRCANLTNDISNFNLTNVKNIEQTFYGCEWLVEYTVPNSVEVIGEAAFANCYNLSNIEIPDSVKVIEGWAFQFTPSLTSIKLPNKLETLGYGVFLSHEYYAISGLTEIEIPASVKTIGDYAFGTCQNLTSVTFEDGSQLKEIGDAAFSGCGLTTITIPEGVTSIGDYAFEWCNSLASVHFTNNAKLQSIGDGAFSGTILSSVVIPKSVTAIGAGAFNANGNSLTTVTFEENSQLKSIGDTAFWGSNFTSINLPEGLEIIGERAFQVCSSLTEITIPASVKEIGEGAFSSCNNLTEINVDPDNEYYTSVDGILFTKDMKTLVQNPYRKVPDSYAVPDGIENITSTALEFGGSIGSIYIPASVKNISEMAFVSCLTYSINVDPANEYYCSVDGVLFTKDMKTLIAYPLANNNTEYSIPNGVEVIASYAFQNYTLTFTEVYIPASVTSIGECAFRGCSNLTEIMFEDDSNITHIGSDAFVNTQWFNNKIANGENVVINNIWISGKNASGEVVVSGSMTSTNGVFCENEKITSVILENGVKIIDAYAFYGCTSLAEITIPTSVTEIGEGAFYYTMIDTINYCGTEEEWNAMTKDIYWDYGILVGYTINFNHVPAN